MSLGMNLSSKLVVHSCNCPRFGYSVCSDYKLALVLTPSWVFLTPLDAQIMCTRHPQIPYRVGSLRHLSCVVCDVKHGKINLLLTELRHALVSVSVSILSPWTVTQDSCAKYYNALGISGPAGILVMFKRHTPYV